MTNLTAGDASPDKDQKGSPAVVTAIVGGSSGCEAILRMVQEDTLGRFRMSIRGVADTNPEAPGMRYARQIGVERVTTDYRDQWELGGWETDPQSWTEFDRRMAFTNLPGRCTLRIFTIAGDLVQTLAFEPEEGSDDTTAFWDLISRNGQAVVSGIYIFAVEPAPGVSGDTQVGKFVILK